MLCFYLVANFFIIHNIFYLKQKIMKRYFFILFIINFFLLFTVFAQKRDLKFQHLTTKEGLSCSDVVSIIQDNKGFIWVGTTDGLNKFDGYSFKVYKHDDNNKMSIGNNNIYCMYKDSKERLWIGTQKGLSMYNPSLDNFTNYIFDKNLNEQNISFNRVRGITEDKLLNLYILNEKGSIYKFNNDSKTFIKISEIKTNTTANSILADDKNNLWVTTVEGLFLYDQKAGKIIGYNKKGNSSFYINDFCLGLLFDKNLLWIGTVSGIKVVNLKTNAIKVFKSESEFGSIVLNIYKDRKNNIWIADAKGLKLYDKISDKFWSYDSRPDDKFSLQSPGVHAIFEDNQGNLWVGSVLGGINVAYADKAFLHLRNTIDFPLNLTRNIISSILEDENGNLWIGSFNQGIDVINLKNKTKKHYEHIEGDPYSLGQSTINTIFEDNKNNIWIGSFSSGLQRFDKNTDRFISYIDTKLYPELQFQDIRSIAEDEEGNFWVVTNGCGIAKINPITKEFHHYKEPQFISNWGFILYIDSDGHLWFGSALGLAQINDDGSLKKQYIFDPKNINSISSNMIRCIIEDSRKNLWIGTEDGLNLFIKKTEKFYCFSKKDGLPNSSIKAIQEDNSGNLWISSNKGISKLSIFWSDELFKFNIKNFDVDDGLQGDEFMERSSFKSKKTGQLFFGGVNGITAFYPDNIKDNTYIPPLAFTDFKLFYHSVPIGAKNSPLKKHINETDHIELKHSQNVISIEFTALNFVVPEKNQYAYFLEGFDEKWYYVGSERKATYTNLSPGNYVFRLKASNNDGLWNEKGISIKIHIKPPFWLTGWAIALYLLCIFLVTYYIYNMIVAREKLKSEIALEKFEKKKDHDLNLMKIQFFTSISHELRTPLTLIIGPLQKLLKEESFNSQIKNYFSLAYRNAQRLSRLVNQLLDFRKLEAGFMKLEVSNDDIVRFVNVIAASFNYIASQRNIIYTVQSSIESLQAWFDPDKLEKILNNLISNAFKYSSNDGEITINLSVGNYPLKLDQQMFFIIKVEDKGIGIPKESMSNLFTLFHQVHDHNPSNTESTGIGLALTKELIDMHKGYITVESELNKGTSFTVYLPFEKNCYSQNEITEKNIDLYEKTDNAEFYTIKSDQSKNTNKINYELPLALIVEDDEDVRYFIKDSLSESFRVIEASNGDQGYSLAIMEIPDLIISDIIMPNSDGFVLCSRLKSDVRTNHIPLIILSAKHAEENKIKGFELGADDYIAKPFNADVLLARAKNLVGSRLKLKEIFNKTEGYITELSNLNKRDKLFIDKAIQIVESHLSDINFDSIIFASEMGMSRSQLYRKFEAITNQTLYDFIRNIKFKKAIDILIREGKTSAEAAFAIGYTKPTNFTRAFTQHFGVTPSEYVANYKKKKNR